MTLKKNIHIVNGIKKDGVVVIRNYRRNGLKSKVVNINSEDYDIYIGRPSKWGNPFKIGRDGTREEVIKKFAHWFLWNAESPLQKYPGEIRQLEGKVLGCHCKPKRCHGDVIVNFIKVIKTIDKNTNKIENLFE
jgi:hypothetical protein